jgi:hypothetical protein
MALPIGDVSRVQFRTLQGSPQPLEISVSKQYACQYLYLSNPGDRRD